jgi:hypothetical protein
MAYENKRQPGDKYYHIISAKNVIESRAHAQLIADLDDWEMRYKVLHRMFSTCYLEKSFVMTVLLCCETEQD